MDMRKVICMILVAFFCLNQAANAMTSTNFLIEFDSINSGGTDWSSSTNYYMNDTVGEQATGYSTSTNYTMHAGYRQADEYKSLSFNVGAQENATKIAYTALTLNSPYTVTVNSAAGYSIGSHITVIENLGLSQKMIVGKITNIGGNVLTVDKWDGDTASISPSPAGGDDFVYKSDGTSVQFGTLSPFVGTTASVQTEVTTSAGLGYTVQVYSDDYFKSGANHIRDVDDGSITGDREEYGASVVGPNAVGVGSDFAVTTMQTLIQSYSNSAVNDRVGMNYKVFITMGTLAGSYTQNVTYLLTANF